ncbi:MAG: LysR family transcriptional regulator [Lachnospiraceae bacterium]
MNIRNIRYFVTIAQERSISSAARRLFVSQQSLSEQLKKLEEEVGSPLFLREVPLRLTRAGEVLFRDAQVLLQNYDTMLSDLKEVTTASRPVLTLGISTYSHPPFLSELLSRFHQICPDTSVRVVRRPHALIGRYIQDMDLYLSYFPLPREVKSIITIDMSPFCACFRERLALSRYGSGWAARRQRLERTGDLALLQDLPFILLLDGEGQIAIDNRACFDTAGFTPKAAFSSENCELNADLCRSGSGVFLAPKDYIQRTLAPERDFSMEQDNPLLCFPVRLLGFVPQISLSCGRNQKLTDTQQTFVSVFRDFFSEEDAATHSA